MPHCAPPTWKESTLAWEAWITLAVLAVTVFALARDLLAPAVAVLSATVVLLLLGVIDARQAFGGFSNPAPITVAALYVFARAVEVTGALEPLVGRVLGQSGQHDGRPQLARLLAPTALASGFLNNTPIVAMLAPQVAEWAKQRGRSVSRLLMPLSFAAVLGGLLTTIGTSTNLVVSGLLEQRGATPLGLFEISPVGAPLAVVGVGVLVLVAPRLLPDRRSPMDTAADSVRQFSVDMLVEPGGPLEGRTVAEAGLRDLQGVYLVRIERVGQAVAPVPPDERLAGGDVLSFAGKVDLIVDLQRKRGLTSTEQQHLGGLDSTRETFFEAVIGPDSPLHGRTLKEAGFRDHYQAAVLAIHRAGERIDAKLGDVRLRLGDTLLVLADAGFRSRWRDARDFLVVARLGGSPPALTRKAPLVGVVALLLVGLAGSGVLPILHAALLAAGLLVAAGVLSPAQARDAVDLNVIVTIAAAFGLGAALETSGLAGALAGALVDGLAVWGALGVLVGVVLATIALTELVTNNAAAVLMFPVAVAAAESVGANPRGFAIAVAVAASASFLSPIGYQTNMMVYGLGGYRFADFARLGFPLTLLALATTVALVPRVWG